MSFKKVSFEEALGNGQLYVRRDGRDLSADDLDSMVVSDLEEAVEIRLLGSDIRLYRVGYAHLADSPSKEVHEAVVAHPEGIGYRWRGVSTGPTQPREPRLPGSNALEFLKDLYGGEMSLINDQGKSELTHWEG